MVAEGRWSEQGLPRDEKYLAPWWGLCAVSTCASVALRRLTVASLWRESKKLTVPAKAKRGTHRGMSVRHSSFLAVAD